MEFAAQAREELMPLILKVLDLAGGTLDGNTTQSAALLSDDTDLPLRAFFTSVLLQAQSMQAEEDVLALFFELSTTAFLGFEYSPPVARAIDDLLAVAERMAFTMTAPDQHRH
ncbi:MAG: hypothetical protein ACNA7W_15985 [Pseudomonadales bacterium]